ncbi:MAG: prolipoprotein diacylglyceryl transferase [Chloroflexi bacterium]|nr:prolipoprotein diacylglyceryl transferase [Chloroflexota bacterium]MCI0845748.1 prolipoprotein diacylglyceryl transferase [Chloroflexota bacterium]
MEVLAAINIGINPNILDFGSVLLSWHGFFTFVAVAVSVYLVHRWGTREGILGDAILSVAVWAIIGGIMGARVVHIIDFWGASYADDPIQVLYVWRGGIAIYGAILGGFAGGASYILIRNSAWFLAMWARFFRFAGEPHRAALPGVGVLADISAPAVLLSMAIGRIGDVINGEHCAKFTDLPWAVRYTYEVRPGITLGELQCGPGVSHPAVAYELLFDLALLAVIWPLRHRLRPHGMFFVLYGALYSTGRFFLNFLRVEPNEYFLDLNQAQILALLVILVAVPLLVFKAQLVRAEPVSPASTDRRGRRGRRAR